MDQSIAKHNAICQELRPAISPRGIFLPVSISTVLLDRTSLCIRVKKKPNASYPYPCWAYHAITALQEKTKIFARTFSTFSITPLFGMHVDQSISKHKLVDKSPNKQSRRISVPTFCIVSQAFKVQAWSRKNWESHLPSSIS